MRKKNRAWSGPDRKQLEHNIPESATRAQRRAEAAYWLLKAWRGDESLTAEKNWGKAQGLVWPESLAEHTMRIMLKRVITMVLKEMASSGFSAVFWEALDA